VLVIAVYDVAVERLDRVRGTLKQYMNWVQNSAFEGELSVGQLEELVLKLTDVIDQSADSVIIYTTSNPVWVRKRVLGVEKSEVTQIL
jgi:CRISPR-associated protein Cas2